VTGPLLLWVPGRPKTKGSLDFKPGRKCTCCSKCDAHLPGGTVTENVAGSKRWRQMMAYAAGNAMAGREPMEGPIGVAAVFDLPVLDVARGRVGDLDKLARNTLDALTDAGVYGDDVQVTRLLLEKRAAADGAHGVSLSVLALS
jgi:Holliday junction resolvase RusA-like endonuclease